MYYVDGREKRGQSSKRLYDEICVDMKSINLSNEVINNRPVWNKAIKPKKLIQHAAVLPANVDSGC